MKRRMFNTIATGVVVGLLAVLGAVPAHAVDVPALLVKRRCNACHDVRKTLIGPPFSAIAVRYRADKDQQEDALAKKILTGGGGAWGVVPMVPNEHVPLDEARAMVKWILELPAP